jgi:hypothetical protein
MTRKRHRIDLTIVNPVMKRNAKPVSASCTTRIGRKCSRICRDGFIRVANRWTTTPRQETSRPQPCASNGPTNQRRTIQSLPCTTASMNAPNTRYRPVQRESEIHRMERRTAARGTQMPGSIHQDNGGSPAALGLYPHGPGCQGPRTWRTGANSRNSGRKMMPAMKPPICAHQAMPSPVLGVKVSHAP